MKSHAELLAEAGGHLFAARVGLAEIYKIGIEGPVPATQIAETRRAAMAAVCCLQELENRAIGFEAPKQG